MTDYKPFSIEGGFLLCNLKMGLIGSSNRFTRLLPQISYSSDVMSLVNKIKPMIKDICDVLMNEENVNTMNPQK